MPRPNRPEPRASYHHGNLREALIAAAVDLIEEGGLDSLSVREAAKRAGVSPGAPFRHFASRTALLTAVAEQATERLRHRVESALAAARKKSPHQQLTAFGHAYLSWAAAHPTHFRVVSDRQLIDYENSASLRRDNGALQEAMRELIGKVSAAKGKAFDPELAQLAARAMVYGLARMAADGHFPEWAPGERGAAAAMGDTFDFFMALLES